MFDIGSLLKNMVIGKGNPLVDLALSMVFGVNEDVDPVWSRGTIIGTKAGGADRGSDGTISVRIMPPSQTSQKVTLNLRTGQADAILSDPESQLEDIIQCLTTVKRDWKKHFDDAEKEYVGFDGAANIKKIVDVFRPGK